MSQTGVQLLPLLPTLPFQTRFTDPNDAQQCVHQFTMTASGSSTAFLIGPDSRRRTLLPAPHPTGHRSGRAPMVRISSWASAW